MFFDIQFVLLLRVTEFLHVLWNLGHHRHRWEPGRGVSALCAGLAAFVPLCNGNKAGLRGQEATPAWTQDQLYLQFSLALKMFGSRGTRASPSSLPQRLMSLVLARSPSRLTRLFLAGGRPPAPAVHPGLRERAVPFFFTTCFYVFDDCYDAASLVLSSSAN